MVPLFSSRKKSIEFYERYYKTHLYPDRKYYYAEMPTKYLNDGPFKTSHALFPKKISDIKIHNSINYQSASYIPSQ